MTAHRQGCCHCCCFVCCCPAACCLLPSKAQWRRQRQPCTHTQQRHSISHSIDTRRLTHITLWNTIKDMLWAYHSSCSPLEPRVATKSQFMPYYCIAAAQRGGGGGLTLDTHAVAIPAAAAVLLSSPLCCSCSSCLQDRCQVPNVHKHISCHQEVKR